MAPAVPAGDWAIFRLTPDKYHYNHCPVSGRVVDCYEINGRYHSCNPGAVVVAATPYSKNRRIVTIIDNGCSGGLVCGTGGHDRSGCPMIGQIDQCYLRRLRRSTDHADWHDAQEGLSKEFVPPRKLDRCIVVEPGRLSFSEDLLRNRFRPGVFRAGFQKGLAVRSSRQMLRCVRRSHGG